MITGTSTGIGAAPRCRLADKGSGSSPECGARPTVRRSQSRTLRRAHARDHRHHRRGEHRGGRGDGRGGRRRSWAGRARQQRRHRASRARSSSSRSRTSASSSRSTCSGQVTVTQAFLPLIRHGRGRIVNVGSIGGRLVLPLHGAYSASKFAMEAVSDALRLELRQWNIPVSLVDPGATETAIFGKTLAAIDEVGSRLDDSGSRGTRSRSRPSASWSRRRPPTRHRRPSSPTRSPCAHRRQAEEPLPRRQAGEDDSDAGPHAARPAQGLGWSPRRRGCPSPSRPGWSGAGAPRRGRGLDRRRHRRRPSPPARNPTWRLGGGTFSPKARSRPCRASCTRATRAST